MASELRVYRPVPPEGYEWALPVDDATFERISRLGVEPGGRSWKAPPFEILSADDGGNPVRRAEMPWYGSDVLVLRDAAIDVVGPLLADRGELLPLAIDDGRLWVFSAGLLAGALDDERSEMVRFDDGRIMELRRPVFRDEVISKAGAFKLSEMPRGQVFLTDELVKAIQATGHSSGTDFDLVYSSAAYE